jgi:hypothetical protein
MGKARFMYPARGLDSNQVKKALKVVEETFKPLQPPSFWPSTTRIYHDILLD